MMATKEFLDGLKLISFTDEQFGVCYPLDQVLEALNKYAEKMTEPPYEGTIDQYFDMEAKLQLECEHPYDSIMGEEKGLPKCLKCGKRLY